MGKEKLKQLEKNLSNWEKALNSVLKEIQDFVPQLFDPVFSIKGEHDWVLILNIMELVTDLRSVAGRLQLLQNIMLIDTVDTYVLTNEDS